MTQMQQSISSSFSAHFWAVARLVVWAAFATFAMVGGAHAADQHPAQALVEKSTAELIALLRDEGERISEDPEFLAAKVEEIVVPNIDFDTMTKLAVGKFWRRAKPEQKTALVSEFKLLLLNTYTGALTEYKGESIKFQPFRPEKREDRAVVRSVFDRSGSDDVPVVYKLRDRDGWSIYDIEVNSISLVTSYRTAFQNEISQGGIDGLLETLKKRNSKS